jgi:Arabinose efflux permease
MKNRENNIGFWTLNLASFLSQTGIVIINLALVYFLSGRGANPFLVGAASAVYSLSYLVGCLALGSFYARFRPFSMVLSSQLGMTLSALLLFFTSSTPVVFLLMVCYGVSQSMLWPQMESWVTRGKEGAELNRATACFNLSWSLASGISSSIAAAFIARSAEFGLMGGMGTLLIAAFVLLTVSLLLPSLRKAKGEREHISEMGEAVDHSTPLRFYSWIAVGYAYIIISVLSNVFPLHAAASGIDTGIVGFLLVARGMGTFLGFIVLGRVSFWQFKFGLILLSQFLLALSALAIAFVSYVPLLAVLFFAMGLLLALMYDFSIFHSASGAIDRGSRMVIHEVVLNVGAVFGSLFGGGMLTFFGFRELMLILSLLFLITVPVEALCHKKKKAAVKAA